MGLFNSKKPHDEYDFIYGNKQGSKHSEPEYGDSYDRVYGYELDKSYEEVFDEDGNSVNCDRCDGLMTWHDGQYVCPECDRVMSRREFFEYIGSTPPGPKCETCGNLYPGCTDCPHGYIEDDE
ncbi:MAG: hypothetical protein NC215_00310 [Ruminococcus sp.]|nr:hypothetical protein [Ruminococcus sp.]